MVKRIVCVGCWHQAPSISMRKANERSKSVLPHLYLRRDPLFISSVWIALSSNPKNTKRSLKITEEKIH